MSFCATIKIGWSIQPIGQHFIALFWSAFKNACCTVAQMRPTLNNHTVAQLHPHLEDHATKNFERVFSKTSVPLLHKLPTFLEFSEAPSETACCAVASTFGRPNSKKMKGAFSKIPVPLLHQLPTLL